MPTSPSPALPTRKVVQEALGESLIALIRNFALKDIESLDEWRQRLAHINDAELRQTIAETLFGARWLYKLGLLLLTKDDEQVAHVRAQISEYSAACEGILVEMIKQKVESGVHFSGAKFTTPKNSYFNLTSQPRQFISSQGFAWLISVAKEENIITTTLETELNWLRKKRNDIHISSRKEYTFTNISRRCFEAACRLISETSTSTS